MRRCVWLRIAIGCLESLTFILRLKSFLWRSILNSLSPVHPSYVVVILPQGPRKMKETLYSKNIHLIQHHLRDGIIMDSNCKKINSSLHTATVAAAVCEAGINAVLGQYPPSVNPEEESLPRIHRCTLRQLRSGKCARLQSYLHRIGKADDNLCPECGIAVHSTNHLFDCPVFPTDLRVKDLWYHPREAANFISSLPSFIRHLPPVPPLPPSIPPEPPP